jgi:YidC/Oxa1 family membrane protein insertase
MAPCAGRGSAFAAWRAVTRSGVTASIHVRRRLPYRPLTPASIAFMERRVFLAIFLAAIVMYAWQALFVPPVPAPTRTESGPAAAAPGDSAAPGTPATQAIAPATPAASASSPSPDPNAPVAVVTEPAEREIVVETATVQAVFTNRGGRLIHWRLKEYRDEQGNPVDLVPSMVPPAEPRPFALQVDDPQLTQRLNNGIYRVSGDENGRVSASDAGATVTFEFQDAAGLQATKVFQFDPRTYVVTFSATVMSGDQTLTPAIAWGPGLGDIGATSGGGSFFTGNYVQPPQALFHRDGDVERLLGDDLTSPPAHEGNFRFAGIDDHYFIITAINPGQARLEYRPLTLDATGGLQRLLVSHTIRVAEGPQDLKFFIGPKQFDLLRAVDGELVRAIDFGIFDWMVVPLLSALKRLYGFIGNYGWAIIAMTILLNLALFYPRHKSVLAMRKMQAIQPEMKAIQERYANLKVSDPAKQKMNTEIMNLYRERGVNPASGCVPMLFTMPFLLAFYSLLSMSIELRGAPFVGWIRDLSVADPFFVIPALMGITMFWQQKITPTTADPTQQRIMMIMPVMFTAMMAFSPSGVVLYWFVSNLWAIGQQYFTNWLIGPPTLATVRPAAERRLKTAGGGRSAGAQRRS